MSGEMAWTFTLDVIVSCRSDVPGLPGVIGALVVVVPPPPGGGTVHAPPRTTSEPAATTVRVGFHARLRRGARGAFTVGPPGSTVGRPTRVVGAPAPELEVQHPRIPAFFEGSCPPHRHQPSKNATFSSRSSRSNRSSH